MATVANKRKSAKCVGTCIVPGCNRPQHACGDCHPCYQMFQRAIKAGEITKEELIAAGLMLPVHNEPKAPASAAIKKLKKQKGKQ